MRIDAHQSFLPGRYLPEHVEHILKRNRFEGAVAVQSGAGVDELRWLLNLAGEHDFVRAVVARADIGDLPEHPKLKGVWAQSKIPAIARRELSVDLVADRSDLPPLARALEEAPDLRVALVHAQRLAPWGPELDELAANPRVRAKLSGMIAPDGLGDFVPRLLAAFGPDRVMFGSDWPFCLKKAGRWKQTLAVFTQSIGAQPMEIREKLLGGAAADFYRI
jgi:L-fuconolactonase